MSKTERMCYIGEISPTSYRRSQTHFTTPVKLSKTLYNFKYDGLVDYPSYDEFYDDLQSVLAPQSKNFTLTGTNKPKEVSRINSICGNCCQPKDCKRNSYLRSFEAAQRVNLTLKISTCPTCGETVPEKRKIPQASTIIHDVRLNGHPAHLNIIKHHHWYCAECEKNISSIRIPSIQHQFRGKFTLRLLRSIFELSIRGTPNGYTAEGYDLKENYVGELCRTFMARTQKDYLTQLIEILLNTPVSPSGNKPAGAFHYEPVFLDGWKYWAIFSSDKHKFYTIVQDSEINSVLAYATSEDSTPFTPKLLSQSAIALAFSTLSPIRRRISFELALLAHTIYSDAKQSNPIASQFSLFKTHRYLTSILTSEYSFQLLFQLSQLLSDPDFDKAKLSPRARKRVKKLVTFIQQVLDTRRNEIFEEIRNKHAELTNFNTLADLVLNERRTQQQPLPLIRIIERTFGHSKYPFDEKLCRLQFYNEFSVLSMNPDGTYQFPLMGEKDGLPQLENSRIGRGIPVSCLEQLLRTGLLEKDSGSIQCFHQRQQECSDGCTLENCPFLQNNEDPLY